MNKYNSGPIVSNKMLKRAKRYCNSYINKRTKKIEKAFTFLAKDTRDKSITITYDWDLAYIDVFVLQNYAQQAMNVMEERMKLEYGFVKIK